MRIRDIFATTIQERIEPVVKVADRRPAIMLNELENLVVTPQWERYLHRILDAYTDAADRVDEQGIGIWISGFFGSGKSLLMKVLGMLLEGKDLAGQDVHKVFLNRLPAGSPDRADIQRFLRICERKISTTAVGGNLHAMLTSQEDPLALIAFKLFAHRRGYTHHWPLAWAVEYQIDARGLSEDFRHRAGEITGVEWEELAVDPEFYLDRLYEAAADVLPDHFSGGVAAVGRAVDAVARGGIDATRLVDRLRRWCAAQDGDGRRHKLLLQLDELGQWIASGNPNDRIMNVAALAERAAEAGEGRIWISVTAHGDVQALRQNVQQEQYAKIIQRFAIQCKLSNDDISQVVEERLLRKTQAARSALEQRFEERSGDLADLGTVQGAQRVYPAPNRENFALFHPYMPWTVAVIPDVVKGIAQAAGRDEALTGSNRTMIGVVQGAIIETPGFLESRVGRVLALADLYDQLASDVPIETKTDLNRVADTVPGATAFTARVARALFLLGQAKYIPTTLDNVTRALADGLDTNLSSLGKRVRLELERLVAAGYAKQVGEQFVFLTTQQRGFQDKVRARQEELLSQSYELSQALKAYDSEEALRFDRVPLQDWELPLKLEIDGRAVRNPAAHVTLRVLSPIQRALDPQIGDDTALRQRSQQAPDTIFLRLAEVPGFRKALALAVATEEVSNNVINSPRAEQGEEDVARQARQVDLPAHRDQVRRLLGQSVRNATIFFRGVAYDLAPGESASAAMRATLSQILPNVYPRFSEVPYRIANENTAVKAALRGNATNAELKALGVYKADGTLNESHPLLSALRGRLPLADQDQPPINAGDLRDEFERPPFGWDGNCVKVGLALLLRASACRLIENGLVMTDPSNPEVEQLLTKEQRFKSVRVQGVRAEIGVKTLLQIRGYVEALYGVKPPLVAATFNNVLGEKLAETAAHAAELHEWAAAAQCPLPLEFEAGTNLVSELRSMAAPQLRLPTFLEQADRLLHYHETLRELTAFKNEHGATYSKVRDFYNKMIYASVDLPEVRQFVNDFRVVSNERSVTTATRWNEIVQSYHAAQQAIDRQVARWRQEAANQLHQLDADLEARVRAAGVPEEVIPDVMAELLARYEDVREQLRRSTLNLHEASKLLSALTGAGLDVQRRLRELQEQFRTRGESSETVLSWQNLVRPARAASAAELDQVLAAVRARILEVWDQQGPLVLE
ncbi:MAG: BREX system P-loop protein BrxC [Ardenticatenaceae bacterium]|nr:BREX system P-loop protein BrxC [Ardenticatenaceae bacterium]